MILAGIILLAIALCITAYNLAEAFRASAAARKALQEIESLEKAEQTGRKKNELPAYVSDPNLPMPTEIVNGIEYIGKLEIPSQGLLLPVISEWSDEKLEISPCRYSGSAYQDNMIIAAHNYQGHFGDLDKLSKEDEICFRDMAGNTFIYQVVETEEIPGTDLDKMESGEWDLTLFTCTYSGKDRVTVRCERVR